MTNDMCGKIKCYKNGYIKKSQIILDAITTL